MRWATSKPEPSPEPPAGSRRPPRPRRPATAGRNRRPARSAETPEQRIEGLRAWIAQVDRKLGVRTYAGGAAVVLALAAGIVGVVLALSAKDESATKDEVARFATRSRPSSRRPPRPPRRTSPRSPSRIDALEGRVNTIAGGQRTTESELSVVQDDIDDLRSQISDLDARGGGPAAPARPTSSPSRACARPWSGA